MALPPSAFRGVLDGETLPAVSNYPKPWIGRDQRDPYAESDSDAGPFPYGYKDLEWQQFDIAPFKTVWKSDLFQVETVRITLNANRIQV